MITSPDRRRRLHEALRMSGPIVHELAQLTESMGLDHPGTFRDCPSAHCTRIRAALAAAPVSTLIRRHRDPFEAGVLRGEKQAWDGEIEQAGVAAVAPSRITTPLAGEGQPDCRYCGGAGYYIGGDEYHLCWCQQPDPDVQP